MTTKDTRKPAAPRSARPVQPSKLVEMTTAEYRASLKPRAARYATSEADEQIALIEWRDAMVGREPRLRWLFHVPNGEYRPKRTGAKLRAMGVQPGVIDLWLPVPARGFVGCALELKAINGQTSPEQDEWLLHLHMNGWYAAVRYGWIAAAHNLIWYLDIQLEEWEWEQLQ